MREIEKLANEKFDGDIPKAIEYAYRNWGDTNNEIMYRIYEEFTDEDRVIADEVIRKLAIEKSGEKIPELDKISKLEASLNMHGEEILNTEKNPYTKRMLLSLVCLLFSAAVPTFIVLFFDIMKTEHGQFIMGVQMVFIFLTAFESVFECIHMVKFNKAKKILKKVY